MEDVRETIKTNIELGEPELALRTAKDAAKKLFDACDAIIEALAKAMADAQLTAKAEDFEEHYEPDIKA